MLQFKFQTLNLRDQITDSKLGTSEVRSLILKLQTSDARSRTSEVRSSICKLQTQTTEAKTQILNLRFRIPDVNYRISISQTSMWNLETSNGTPIRQDPNP